MNLWEAGTRLPSCKLKAIFKTYLKLLSELLYSCQLAKTKTKKKTKTQTKTKTFGENILKATFETLDQSDVET